MRSLLSPAVAVLLLLLGGAAAAQAQAVRTPHVEAELVPGSATVQPGGTAHVALRQKIKPGWHTYWRNPGDSGEPTTLDWTLPEGWSAGRSSGGAPSAARSGRWSTTATPMKCLLPVPLRVPRARAQARPSRPRRNWLVCEKICVPEQAALTMDLPSPRSGRAHPQHVRTPSGGR